MTVTTTPRKTPSDKPRMSVPHARAHLDFLRKEANRLIDNGLGANALTREREADALATKLDEIDILSIGGEAPDEIEHDPNDPNWAKDPNAPEEISGAERERRVKRAALEIVANPPAVATIGRAFPMTDIGNAERFAARHGDDMRYCHPGKAWWSWSGSKWEPDEKGNTYRRAKDTVRAIRDEAAAVRNNEELQEAYFKWAARSEGAGSIRSMLECARGEEGISVMPAEFDRDPWLFNCANGTIELTTGTFREHRRGDLISKISPVVYDKDAECPLFDQFLRDVQPSDDIRGYLQRLAGYWLTGAIREHVFPIFIGKGRNGKGTFVDTILHILGDYGKQVPTELLMAKKNESHPADKATLWNARFAAAEETDEGRALNVALVKQLTGGGRISARFMGENWFDFDPTHKMVLSTNNRPVIRETKEAIWERVQIVDWSVIVPRAKRVLNLKEKLQAEAPGILRWAVAGCLAWQQCGLMPPAAVQASTSAYREDENPLREFLSEECVRDASPQSQVDSAMVVNTLAFLEKFNAWAARQNYPEMNTKTLRDRMLDEGFAPPHKGPADRMHWRGVSFKEATGGGGSRWGERDD